MARMTKAQIMEKIEVMLTNNQLTQRGEQVAEFILKKYKEGASNVPLQDAKDSLLILLSDYQKYEEEDIDVDDKILAAVVENSLKKSNKKSEEEKIEIGAKKIESIINKPKSDKPKSDKPKDTPKPKETTETILPPKPSEEDIVELVGYRYSYPKFPLEFTSKVLDGSRLKSRGDIKTLVDFNKVEGELYKANQSLPKELREKFIMAVYVNQDDIVDPRTYDYLDMYPKQTFKQILKEYGGTFPQDLDILEIMVLNDKVLIGLSVYTGIPYTVSYRGFNNNDKLNCRANYQGLDYQIYQVTPIKKK